VAVDAAVVAMLVAAAADLALLSSLLRGRSRPQSRALAALLGASAWWAVAYAVELGAANAEVGMAAGALKYAGIVAVPPTMLLFVSRVTGRDRFVHPRSIALLAVEPVVVLALLLAPWTAAWFRSVDADLWPGRDAITVGPLFWAHMAYSLAVLAVAVGVLVVALARVSARYRPQSAALLVALVPPFLANALFNFEVQPLAELDLTPIALAVSGTLLVPLLASFPLFHLVPVARSTVVDVIDDAVVVLDGDLVVVDVNPAARRLLGAGLVGRPSRAVLPDVPALHHDDDGGGAGGGGGATRTRREAAVIATPAGPRHVEVDVTTLRAQGERGGRVVLIRDVTERHLVEARLERLAHYDVLTGLPNRVLFYDRLKQSLALARRN
jgi:PAS domain S-box-containing protein